MLALRPFDPPYGGPRTGYKHFRVVHSRPAYGGHIIARLENALRPCDTAAQKAQSEIDLIREFRTRLIADVVTGKLDVRHLASALGDEITESELEDLDEGIDDEEMLGEDEPELVKDTEDDR